MAMLFDVFGGSLVGVESDLQSSLVKEERQCLPKMIVKSVWMLFSAARFVTRRSESG
jgi:hypothetical protein